MFCFFPNINGSVYCRRFLTCFFFFLWSVFHNILPSLCFTSAYITQRPFNVFFNCPFPVLLNIFLYFNMLSWLGLTSLLFPGSQTGFMSFSAIIRYDLIQLLQFSNAPFNLSKISFKSTLMEYHSSALGHFISGFLMTNTAFQNSFFNLMFVFCLIAISSNLLLATSARLVALVDTIISNNTN